MRQPRIKIPDATAVYHCISRCVGNQFLFDAQDKEQFGLMLHQQADFCGVQIITHGLLDNHFHLEIRIPPTGKISDAGRTTNLTPYWTRQNGEPGTLLQARGIVNLAPCLAPCSAFPGEPED